MDKFIYETKFTNDICDGLIDFYNTSEQFQKHEGQISNSKVNSKSQKESLDMSIPMQYIEFDKRLVKYFDNLHSL